MSLPESPQAAAMTSPSLQSRASSMIDDVQQQQQPRQPHHQGASSSASSGSSGAVAGAVLPEDCRDYLRTGRCKYGSSCKYSHPSNVQSGGGMKAPINPGEPMFPLRPTEPICQYYMKHGTCKFGQACKFHHPPQLHPSSHLSLHALVGGGGSANSNASNGGGVRGLSGPVLMSLGGGQPHPQAVLSDHAHHHMGGGGPAPGVPHSLLCNPIGTDPASGSMILQFLPQRPDEPDCIYFLKNGRCKYGATCRYHHPIAYQPTGRQNSSHHRGLVVDDPPRRLPPTHSQPVRMGSGGMNPNRASPPDDSGTTYRVHSNPYMSQMIPAYSVGQQSSSLSSHGDVQYVNLDPMSSSPLQAVPVVSMDGTTTSYAFPISGTTGPNAAMNGHDHNSSGSSLASSYETAAGSSLEPHHLHHGGGGDAGASAALWNRARRNGSGGSLSAYHDGGTSSSGSRMGLATAKSLPHSASEGNIVARRNRSTSYGSHSDASYYDASSIAAPLSRAASAGSWRHHSTGGEASMARGGAGGGRTIPGAHYATANHEVFEYGANGSPSSNRQRFAVMMPSQQGGPPGMRLRRSPRGNPGGIRRGEGDEGFTMMTSALLNMLDAPEEMVGYGHDLEEEEEGDEDDVDDPQLYYEAASYPQAAQLAQPYPHAHPDDSFDPEFFERLSLSRDAGYGAPERNGPDGSSWSPALRGGGGGGTVVAGNAHSNGFSPNPRAFRQGDDESLHRVFHQHAATMAAAPTNGPTSSGVGGGGGGDYGLFLS